jgi:hypothetical protein
VEAKHPTVDHLDEVGWSQIFDRLVSWIRKPSAQKELAKHLMLRRHSAVCLAHYFGWFSGINILDMWQARKSVTNVRMVFGLFTTNSMTVVKV